MSISILLIKQIFSLVLIGIFGYVLRKNNLINHEQSKGLSVISVYIITPCTLYASFQTQISTDKLNGFLYALTASIMVLVIYFILMKGIRKLCVLDAIESASVIYSNAGAIVIPLVLGVFGPEYVFYTSAYLMVQNALLWTHAWIVISGQKKIIWRKVLLHPCILAIAAGFVSFLVQFSFPSVVETALDSVGACMGPIALLGVGMMIAEADLKEILKSKRIYLVLGLRLLVYPVAAMLVCFAVWKLFPVEIDPYVYLIVLLASCGPAATSLTQMAQIHDNQPSYASSINVLTTLGSILTIPLVMTLAQML